MRICQVAIKNYRSLKDVLLSVDDYTVLIGANGAGKSSVLYALDWFFNGTPLHVSDFSGYSRDADLPDDCLIEVSVTFADLTVQDRKRLHEYGRGKTATFKKSWSARDQKDKIFGNSKQGPGFHEVRSKNLVGEFRPAYKALQSALTDLPDLGPTPTKIDVTNALAVWESDETHSSLLVDIFSSEANHMFGVNGVNVIQECIRLVLVPAATDMTAQVGATGRGTAVGQLIGALITEAGTRAQEEWLEQNSATLEELMTKARRYAIESTEVQTARINSRLQKLVPSAQVTLSPSVPAWAPKTEASVTTEVTIDGNTNDLGLQGHGVQRAVMISMFQALLPDEDLVRDVHRRSEISDEATNAERLNDKLAELPNLVICIEEPEIYQHPIRARSFARTLGELSAQANAQVIAATHSPYFVRPEQFESLRRFTLESGATQISLTSSAEIESTSGINQEKIAKIVNKQLPSVFSEGFFSDYVVIVEGDTDKAVIEAIAHRLGVNLDMRGVSVLELSSKESLQIPFEVLTALGIQVFTFVDGDYLGAKRKYPTDQTKELNAHISHKSATEKVLSWLPPAAAKVGSMPYSFGGRTVVTDKYVIWEDDLESELEKWPSFCEELEAAGGKLRLKKDLYAYRNAVMDASLDDIPYNLRCAIEALQSFK